MRWITYHVLLAAFVAATLPAPLRAQSGTTGAMKASKARVSLHASVQSVAPATPFELAFAFEIEEEWHIYWQNPGDSGMPPTVLKWDLPPGFRVGSFRFPVPREHHDAAGLTTNVLEGEPVLLVTVTPPEEIKAESVRIGASVRSLVCKELCLIENAQVGVELPVAAAGAPPVPANAETFRGAERLLPKPESKYVRVTPRVSVDRFEAGKGFDVLLDVAVARGFHIQSHRPLIPSFIASRVLMESTPGVSFEAPVFPEPKVRKDAVLGQLSEFAGSITIRIPANVDDPAPTGAVHFGGLFTFQACNERGQCFPPETVSFSTVVGSGEGGAGGIDAAAPTSGTISTEQPSPDGAEPAAGAIPEMPEDAGTPHAGSTGDAPGEGADGGAAGSKTLLGWLAFAFIGGLILNVMPCVLPVISIKIHSFIQQSDEHPRRVFLLGLTFAAGVIGSFWVLAAAVIVLKALGHSVGWGFQLQSPWFTLALATVVFIFGLNLFGVFEITLPGAAPTKLSSIERREGYPGAFFKGVLATLLATPCMAPFLGTALGFAFAASNAVMSLVLTSTAVGMALPYVLLCARPAWLRHLPKPGAWMERFKQFMGFALMGTVVFLFWSLKDQIGAVGLFWSLAFLTAIGLAAWIIGLPTPSTSAGRRAVAWVIALVVTGGGYALAFSGQHTIPRLAAEQHGIARSHVSVEDPAAVRAFAAAIPAPPWEAIPWQKWAPGLPDQLSAAGYTVYVDYTASWCATCIANKIVTLESGRVRRRMGELGVVPLKADFSNPDPDIVKDLERFGRGGVPLNVIYPANRPDRPILLPEQLVGRADLVLERLESAGPSVARPDERTAMSTPPRP
jgi:thiol:disulfide interchange protein DsbD